MTVKGPKLGETAHNPYVSSYEAIQKFADTIEDPVRKHTFNRNVDETLNECLGISNQRGGEYQDSWALEHQRTSFIDNLLGHLPHDTGDWSPTEKRLVMLAALCDVKISRLKGPYKRDTVIDLINYTAAFAGLMQDYQNGE